MVAVATGKSTSLPYRSSYFPAAILMEELFVPPFVLALLFFGVAFTYSSVGLGGGSSYTALMAIFGVSHVAIPTISLTLNLLVTSVGSLNFIREKHSRLRLIVPFLITSIPMAYIGGCLKLPKEAFYWMLLASLLFVALRIFFWDHAALKLNLGKIQQFVLSLALGSVLGLVAGIVGIGGGIYLVPLVVILGLGSAKEAAASGAIFVWGNSFAGLMARVQHHSVTPMEFLPLIVAVVLGGGLGSYIGSSNLQPRSMEKILGVIVLVAIVFLIRRMLST